MTPTSRYATAQAETASPERVMVLLFEKALAHIRAGAAALEAGKAAEANEPLSKANQIVAELARTLDPSRAPALAANLKEVYAFVGLRLLDANTRKDPKAAREAEKVFAPVADAFAEAVRVSGGGA